MITSVGLYHLVPPIQTYAKFITHHGCSELTDDSQFPPEQSKDDISYVLSHNFIHALHAQILSGHVRYKKYQESFHLVCCWTMLLKYESTQNLECLADYSFVEVGLAYVLPSNVLWITSPSLMKATETLNWEEPECATRKKF